MKRGWYRLRDAQLKPVPSAYKLYDLIKKPLITEKTTSLSQNNQVVFQVDQTANKYDIKQAVETIFKVKVDAVNTINVKGKTKRFKGFVGQRKSYKKAIVTLKEGHTIDISVGA